MTSWQKIIKYAALAFAILLTVSIFTGIASAAMEITRFFSSEPIAGENRSFDLKWPVDRLYIDIGAGSLEIRAGNTLTLESNHRYLQVSEENGILRIQDARKWSKGDFSDVRVILTLPPELVLEKTEISTGAGTVQIQSLITQQLRLDLGAGEVIIHKLLASDQATVSTGAGKLTIEMCSLRNLDLDMGVGELRLCGHLPGKSKLNLGVGRSSLTILDSRSNYELSFSKGLGEARLDGERLESGRYPGTGSNRLEIDGGVGSIDIRFEQPNE